MGFPFVEGLELADGVGIAPTQPAGSLGFRDRGITSLPTIRTNWLPDLDSHQDKRLNRPPCYFDYPARDFIQSEMMFVPEWTTLQLLIKK